MSSSDPLYARALATFGQDRQIRKCIQELNELAVALSHYQEGRCDADEVAAEVADVLITAEQMAGVVGEERVIRHAMAKRKRLAALLDKAEGWELP